MQAISAYGHVRLKSERASIYITTYALPQATQNGESLIEDSNDIDIVRESIYTALIFFQFTCNQ